MKPTIDSVLQLLLERMDKMARRQINRDAAEGVEFLAHAYSLLAATRKGT